MDDARRIAGAVWHEYERRAPSTTPPRSVDALLAQEGFFDAHAPLIDVASGPSPHVGWRLLPHLRDGQDIAFADWRADWLGVHKELYQVVTQRECPDRRVRAYWLLGDAQQEPHLLTGRAALVHGDLPRLTRDDRLVLPSTHEDMVATLGGILDARPERLALYLREEHPRYPESPSRVLPALDQLGAKYRLHERVASADFTPREGGYLVLITP